MAAIFWLSLGAQQILDSLSFFFLLTHIWLYFDLKNFLNNRDNHENLNL